MIRELKQKGWTISAIAKETGFDRKIIRKYLEAETVPTSSKKRQKGSILDPYKPYLLERIKEGTTDCMVLIEEIRAQGYKGKSTILREFVQPYREAPKKQATVRFETIPGRQAQVDWAEEIGEFIVDGVKRPLYAFIMILSYSRKRYIEFTTDMTQGTLMKCYMNAFSYFNGIPQQLLYDNMRTVVTKHSVSQILLLHYPMSKIDHWQLTLPSRKVIKHAFITRRTLKSVRLAANSASADLVEDFAVEGAHVVFLDIDVKKGNETVKN